MQVSHCSPAGNVGEAASACRYHQQCQFLDDYAGGLRLCSMQHQRVVIINNVNDVMLEQIETLNRKITEFEANLHNKKSP